MTYSTGSWDFRHTVNAAPLQEKTWLAVRKRWGWVLITRDSFAPGERTQTRELFKTRAQLMHALRDRYPALAEAGWQLFAASGLAVDEALQPSGPLVDHRQHGYHIAEAEGAIPTQVGLVLTEGGLAEAKFRVAVIAGNDHDRAHFTDCAIKANQLFWNWDRHFRYITEQQFAA